MKSRTLIVAGSVAAFTLIGGSAAIAATSSLGDSRDSGVSQVVPARATTNHPESYEHSSAARGKDDSRREHAVPKSQPSRSAGSHDDSSRGDSHPDNSGSGDSRTGSSYDDSREHATPSTAATHHHDSRPGDSRDDSSRDDSRDDSSRDDSRSDDSHEHGSPSSKASAPGHEDRD